MLGKLPLSNLLLVALFISLSLATADIAAQSVQHATRSARLNVYGGATQLRTDHESTNCGFVVGGTETRHTRVLDLGLDVRHTRAERNFGGQNLFMGSLKLEKAGADHFQPYGNFMNDLGTVTFTHPLIVPGSVPYTHDDSTIYDFGGGVDIDITCHFAFKGSAHLQHRKIFHEQPAFSPVIISAGVVYRIPYQRYRTHS